MNILNLTIKKLFLFFNFFLLKIFSKNKFIEFKYFILQIFYYLCGKKVKFRKLNHWEKINFNRISIINYAASKYQFNLKYLEIGCDSNLVFNALPISQNNKIGVDPNRGGTIRTSSDNFFRDNNQFFDIIFIDGLHEYKQTRKDIINSLKCLNENGTIFIHDLIPVDWKTEHVPRISDQWNGDVWKVIFEIMNSQNLILKIVDCDNGVGILRKKGNFEYNKMDKILDQKNYNYFVENFKNIPLINFEESLKYLNTLHIDRKKHE